MLVDGVNCLSHVFYRSPNKAFKNNCIVKVMETYFQKIVVLNKIIIIMGDLNVNLNEENAIANKLNLIFNRHGLKIKNNFNTRDNLLSQTKIDVVLTNYIDTFCSNH